MAKIEDNPFAMVKFDSRFEDLCRDLLARQLHLHNAKKIKEKGHRQYGGDITADIKDSVDIVVAQCKYYTKSTFSKKDIGEAISDFIKFWDSFWKQKKVTKFYLIISQPRLADEQFEAIQTAKEDLYKYGITLIDWWQDDLKEEIKRHPDLVKEYLGTGHWLDTLCPGAYSEMMAATYSVGSPDKDILATVGLENYKNVLSNDLINLIEPIREKVRYGKQLEAEKDFIKLKEQHFNLIKPDAKAELLSFEIRLFFPQRRNIQQAKEIIDQIKKIEPNFSTTILDALVLSKELGYEKALEKLNNVSNTKTLNLKLSFLINLNKTDEFLESFSDVNIEHDDETKWLYALYLVLDKNITEATKVIDEVVEKQPYWYSLKLSQAIIYYLNGVPEQLLNRQSLVHPTPLPLGLLKTDNVSNDKRKAAIKLFEDVLQSENLEQEQKLIIESWKLACLADSYDLHKETIEYCTTILSINPSHPYILLWSINRNLQINYSKSLQVLENEFSKNAPDESSTQINQCIMLISLCLREKLITKAKRYLITLKPLLESISQADLYHYWKCQIEIKSENELLVFKNYALKLSDKQLSQDLQVSALQNLVARDPNRKNRRLLLNFLKKIVSRSKNDIHLTLYAETCYRNGKLQEIVNSKNRLLKFANNLSLAGVLITAHYETGKFQTCLELIEKFSFLYPDGKIPNHFHQYQIYSLFRTGKLIEADKEVTKYFEYHKSPEAYQVLFNIKKYTDDTYGITKATKEIRDKLDLIEPESKFVIAQTISAQDIDLAKEVWRDAKNQTLKYAQQHLSDAISLGFELGLDNELGELFAKTHNPEISKKAGIETYNVDETIEIYNGLREKQHEIDNLYLQGRIPTHFVAKKLNVSLSEIYISIAERNIKEDSILRRTKLLNRTAGRFNYNNQSFISADKPALYLDISTLLLIDRLNLLEKVEEIANIHFSNKILFTLGSEIKSLADGQPAETEKSAQLITAVEDNLFSTIEIDEQKLNSFKEENQDIYSDVLDVDLITLICSNEQNGFAVLETPFRGVKTNIELDFSKIFPQIISWTAVIKYLHENSLLSLEEIRRCQKVIDSINADTVKIPHKGKLFLTEAAFSKFNNLGLLEKISRYFHLYLNEETIKIAKDRIDAFKHKAKLKDRILKLESKIKANASSIYTFISEEDLNPIPPAKGEKARLTNDYRFKSTEDLIRLNRQGVAFVAIDDRYFSKFPTVNNQIPIVGIFEILEKLLCEEQLSEDEYYQKLLQLRNENFRYLPITEKEIDYYLKLSNKTNLENNGSQELTIIRQYLAACILDSDFLEKPEFPLAPDQHGTGELEFIIQSKRVISNYICKIWKDEPSLELAETKAYFIFYSLYPNLFLIRHTLPNYEIHNHGLFHYSWDISDLYLQSFSLLSSLNKNDERIKAYFNWVDSLFTNQLKRNTFLLKETADLMSNIIISSALDSTGSEELSAKQRIDVEKLTKTIYVTLISLLPEILQEQILKNGKLVEVLNINPFPSISIGGLTFNCDNFYQGVRKSINGEQNEVAVDHINLNRKVVFSSIFKEKGKSYIDVKEDDKIVFQLPENEFGIYSETVEERKAFLSDHRNAFDCDNILFESEKSRIAAIENPTDRFFAIKELSANSIEIAYLKLERQITQTKSFRWQEIVDLPIQGLLKHFRLDSNIENDDNFADLFNIISQQLLAEEGLEKTLNKLARFPHKLPSAVVSAFDSLELEQRKVILEKFHKSWQSPLGQLQYFSLLLRESDEQELIDKAKRKAEHLLDSEEGRIEFEIFQVVLQLMYRLIISNEITNKWSSSVKLLLTWAHAVKVFDLIMLTQEKPEDRENLLDYLDKNLNIPSYETFDFDSALWSDCLHPRFLEETPFYGFATYALFSEIDPENVKKVKLSKLLEPVIFNDIENTLFSSIMFEKDFSNRTNNTSSILFSKTLERFDWLETEKNIAVLSSNTVEEYFVSLFEELNQDFNDKLTWKYLLNSSDGFCLKAPYSQKFIQLTKKFNFEQTWDKDHELAQMILFFIARQKNILPEDQKSKITGWIKTLVFKLAQKYPYHSFHEVTQEIEDSVYFVLNLILVWSIKENDPLGSSNTHNDLLLEAGQIWAYLSVRLEAHFYRNWLNLPPEHNQNIGKNIFLMRSLK